MRWCSVLSRPEKSEKSAPDKVVKNACQDVLAQLDGCTPDLLIAFVSAKYHEQYKEIGSFLAKTLTPKAFIGCSAGGLIGGGNEVEDESGVALAAAILPDVDVRTFHLQDVDMPDSDDSPTSWEQVVGVKKEEEPAFILLPDPYSFRIETLVQGLDYAFPQAQKIGGLASGATAPGLNALFLNGKVYKRGAVGAAITGNIILDTVVAQGCRPIGKALRVTKCDHNILYELDDKPALLVLKDLLESVPEHEQTLARNALFLGLAMDEFKPKLKVGDFLIRNIIGIEPKSGALVVAELLHDGRTVQFHVRDAATSSEDLRIMLKNYVDSTSDGAKHEGALLFSCLGRGTYLYGSPNHDSFGFRQYLGEIPLSGFFCNGEIGPVGGTTFIHGYTSSFGIFKAKARKGSAK
jgi:small ligand-binding sensory domain FIST